MNESEVKKCPKCRGDMVQGILSVEGGPGWKINWRVSNLKWGEGIVAYRCKQCGYSELYSTDFPRSGNMEE